MSIENEIEKHLAASKAKSKQRAANSAQYEKRQAEGLAFFEALKKSTIIPAIEAVVAALSKGGVNAALSQAEQIERPNNVPIHSFAGLEVNGAVVRFEWIGHKEKIRVFASRALNHIGIPVNDQEAFVAPVELSTKIVNSYLLATIRLVT